MAKSLTASLPLASIPFQFGDITLRAHFTEGQAWFICRDVAQALGFSDPRSAARHLDADERGGAITATPGGLQKLTTVNESGLYSLILRSRKLEARRFAKWVTSEVLPNLRKTGTYTAAQKNKPKQPLPHAESAQHAINKIADDTAGQEARALLAQLLQEFAPARAEALAAFPPELHSAIAQRAMELSAALVPFYIEALRRLVANGAVIHGAGTGKPILAPERAAQILRTVTPAALAAHRAHTALRESQACAQALVRVAEQCAREVAGIMKAAA